jgi:hypothetical protein
MPITNYNNGIASFGIPQIMSGNGRITGGSMFGNTYFVDSNLGSDGYKGLRPDKAWKSLTFAFSELTRTDEKNATVFVAPGDYSGNYSTPLNGDAAFCALIGVQATDIGFGPWAAASTTTSPIINVRARGWRISGFEFDGATSEASLKLTTSGTSNANYTQVESCLFTGGKYGIDYVGAPTYAMVYNCLFEDILTSAMICTDSSTDTPRRCIIQGNHFRENISHIAMNPRGFKSSTIKNNVFQLDGHSRDATVLLDTRGGGGNQIVANYFDITKAQYIDDSSTAFVRTASTDWGAGNWCSDGDPGGVLTDTDDISH